MTKVKLTKESLLDIGGFTSLRAKQLAGKHRLQKDLRISSERVLFLANRFNKTLKSVGSKKQVQGTTLRADNFSVTDCIVLMLKKGLDVELKPEETKDLIIEARKEL